ncbi:hypothetical protein ADEAN_000754800 [Angomonas deanei]|uniref:Uncharacterized protein n=1 Tax=Angomonas deanei TaxID=59799 RepID=A0A7G2CM81_9TRYP|nr:hypothetical protein ADEAN_000754800 [Angomonas deanei]
MSYNENEINLSGVNPDIWWYIALPVSVFLLMLLVFFILIMWCVRYHPCDAKQYDKAHKKYYFQWRKALLCKNCKETHYYCYSDEEREVDLTEDTTGNTIVLPLPPSASHGYKEPSPTNTNSSNGKSQQVLHRGNSRKVTPAVEPQETRDTLLKYISSSHTLPKKASAPELPNSLANPNPLFPSSVLGWSDTNNHMHHNTNTVRTGTPVQSTTKSTLNKNSNTMQRSSPTKDMNSPVRIVVETVKQRNITSQNSVSINPNNNTSALSDPTNQSNLSTTHSNNTSSTLLKGSSPDKRQTSQIIGMSENILSMTTEMEEPGEDGHPPPKESVADINEVRRSLLWQGRQKSGSNPNHHHVITTNKKEIERVLTPPLTTSHNNNNNAALNKVTSFNSLVQFTAKHSPEEMPIPIQNKNKNKDNTTEKESSASLTIPKIVQPAPEKPPNKTNMTNVNNNNNEEELPSATETIAAELPQKKEDVKTKSSTPIQPTNDNNNNNNNNNNNPMSNNNNPMSNNNNNSRHSSTIKVLKVVTPTGEVTKDLKYNTNPNNNPPPVTVPTVNNATIHNKGTVNPLLTKNPIPSNNNNNKAKYDSFNNGVRTKSPTSTILNPNNTNTTRFSSLNTLTRGQLPRTTNGEPTIPPHNNNATSHYRAGSALPTQGPLKRSPSPPLMRPTTAAMPTENRAPNHHHHNNNQLNISSLSTMDSRHSLSMTADASTLPPSPNGETMMMPAVHNNNNNNNNMIGIGHAKMRPVSESETNNHNSNKTFFPQKPLNVNILDAASVEVNSNNKPNQNHNNNNSKRSPSSASHRKRNSSSNLVFVEESTVQPNNNNNNAIADSPTSILVRNSSMKHANHTAGQTPSPFSNKIQSRTSSKNSSFSQLPASTHTLNTLPNNNHNTNTNRPQKNNTNVTMTLVNPLLKANPPNNHTSSQHSSNNSSVFTNALRAARSSSNNSLRGSQHGSSTIPHKARNSPRK